MTELVSGQVKEIKYDLSMSNGMLKLSGEFDGNGIVAAVSLSLDAALFLDKLKVLIPGTIDDAIIDGIKAAFLPAAPAAAAPASVAAPAAAPQA